MLAAVGGGVLALGFIWLLVDAMLRYSASHGIGIVLWHGKWPADRAGRSAVQSRLDAAQERELRGLKRVRPIPIALIVCGVVLITVAAVSQ